MPSLCLVNAPKRRVSCAASTHPSGTDGVCLQSAVKGDIGGMHSLNAGEWVALQQALVRGLPDWAWHGQVWRPIDDLEGWEEGEEDGHQVGESEQVLEQIGRLIVIVLVRAMP